MKDLIANFLEPLACLMMLVAFVIVQRRKCQPGLWLLIINQVLCTALLLVGSIGVFIDSPQNNIWVYDLLALSSAVLISAYYHRHLMGRLQKRLAVVLSIMYVVYAVYHHVTLGTQWLFDSIGFVLLAASVTLYAFCYFHQLLQNVTEASIFRDFNFWLSSAYLLYFAGSFFIFGSYYYLTQKFLANPSKHYTNLLTWLWGVHNVLVFISAVALLTASLWISYRKRSD